MKYILVTLTLIITACTPATELNLAKAGYLCRDRGGLYSFNGTSSLPVTCKNGTVFSEKVLYATIIDDPNFYP